MKRRKFMGLLVALPFVGGYVAKAMAKQQALVTEGSRLVLERMHEPTVDLVFIKEGNLSAMEIWSGFEHAGCKEEVVWYTRDYVDRATGKLEQEFKWEHVWTHRIREWKCSSRPAREIIARIPATPEVLRICRQPLP